MLCNLVVKFDYEARGFDKEQIDDFNKECQKKNITNEQKEETNSNIEEKVDKKTTIKNDVILKHILELKEEVNSEIIYQMRPVCFTFKIDAETEKFKNRRNKSFNLSNP